MIVMGNLLKSIRRIIDTGMIGTKTLLVSQTALTQIEKKKTEKGGKRIREKGKKKGRKKLLENEDWSSPKKLLLRWISR